MRSPPERYHVCALRAHSLRVECWQSFKLVLKIDGSIAACSTISARHPLQQPTPTDFFNCLNVKLLILYQHSVGRFPGAVRPTMPCLQSLDLETLHSVHAPARVKIALQEGHLAALKE